MADFPKEQKIKEKLQEKFGSLVSNINIARERRMYAEIDGKNLIEVISFLYGELGFNHLPTISGVDAGENLEFLYHLASGGIILTLKAKVPSSSPEIKTVTEIFTGATSFERELEDMFGAKVKGLKPGRNYPLPEGWPKGQHPLRKSWKISDLYPVEKK